MPTKGGMGDRDPGETCESRSIWLVAGWAYVTDRLELQNHRGALHSHAVTTGNAVTRENALATRLRDAKCAVSSAAMGVDSSCSRARSYVVRRRTYDEVS
jgi:hypothetical protein